MWTASHILLRSGKRRAGTRREHDVSDAHAKGTEGLRYSSPTSPAREPREAWERWQPMLESVRNENVQSWMRDILRDLMAAPSATLNTHNMDAR